MVHSGASGVDRGGARGVLIRAAALFADLGDTVSQAGDIGDCNAAAGDTDAARAAWRRALGAAGSQEHEEVERVRAALAQRSPAPAQR